VNGGRRGRSGHMGIVSSQSVCRNFVLLGIIYQKKAHIASKMPEEFIQVSIRSPQYIVF
jgi:hypothetical protein